MSSTGADTENRPRRSSNLAPPTCVAEWIQKCSLAAESEIEQMDLKVLLMLAVITDLPRAPPGHPGRAWVGDGARVR